MLKIKDNVDLKKLKKFGFKIKESADSPWKYEKDDRCGISCLTVYADKEIGIYLDGEWWCCSVPDDIMDFLFDLIQAGLVEKVGEK